MAALYICQRSPPNTFPRKSPLALPEHYELYKAVLNQLDAPRGDSAFELARGVPKSAAQAYALHYYVRPDALTRRVRFFYSTL
jgi:hypothetical protein